MPDSINQNVSIEGDGAIVVGQGNVIITSLSPADKLLQSRLSALKKKVDNIWIKGVLKKSIHTEVLLELGMKLREEAVDNPWGMVIEKPDESREVLPQGSKIKDIFEEANGLLLILGEAGSGKTTTLLQLARDLIASVDSDFTEPVPIVFHLSTWTNEEQVTEKTEEQVTEKQVTKELKGLALWLLNELHSRYYVPKSDGETWVKERRILALLDGLDEVREADRKACVERINDLVKNYGLSAVVCSRREDYAKLGVRLAFYRAIYLQPLTYKQADEYLNNVGEKMAGLRFVLQTNEDLQELAKLPFMLNVMILAFKDTPLEELKVRFPNKDSLRKHVMDEYVHRQLRNKSDK